MVQQRHKRDSGLHDREGICISARTGENLAALQAKIEGFFQESQIKLTLLIPYDKGGMITELHALNAVRSTEYVEQGTLIDVSLPVSEKDKYLPYSKE